MTVKNDIKLPKAILFGTLLGIVVTLVFTLIFALVVSSASLSLKASGVLATLTLVAAAFSGGFASALKRGEKGLVTGAIAGVVYYMLVVLLSLAILRSAVTSSLIIKLALILFSSSIGGIIGVNGFKRRKI